MLTTWLLILFLLGAAVGSFLNVCIYRLPYEKSILWPSSLCGQCLQPIRWYDNLPLLSYWLLRGRCRKCDARFSMRYFFVELFTGLGFASLFYLEVVRNVLGLELLEKQKAAIALGAIPAEGWIIFGYHAVLFCFLVVASLTDIDHLEIPMPITVTGTLAGLAGGAIFWPWLPAEAVPRKQPVFVPPPGGAMADFNFKSGIYPWPLWTELPTWLPLHSPLTGLATGLAGVLAGMLVLRAINFLFKTGRGREGIGMGDADLMMMVGSFLGWQPVVVAFFVAVFPGLAFGIIQLVLRGDRPFPYGPSLAAGSVLTWLGWQWITQRFPLQLMFFDWMVLVLLASAGAVFMFVAALVLRLLRGPAQ
jgi:leader peptidase (prepilin peptidase)/N-methyltransferase